ncbi:phenylacetate--CoA ligase family protein [Geodermatophilus sp. FMUSA9-8]|uniref:phenylacetate--CoA ligase family protein n=1 Tax=Geodermatophilus sp. FMUSA9-8 TaxID=3120155 RepID=UPI003009A469
MAPGLGRSRPPVVDPGAASTPRLLLDARRTYRGGREVIAAWQRARLAAAVAFARGHSPYYRELYAGLPERVEDASLLPVTTKATLMGRFDDVITDARVSRQGVEDFVADPANIGVDFAGSYTVATTSGTTGTRGLFVIDGATMSVVNAMAARMITNWLRPNDGARIIAGGARMAMVTAAGGHFASAAAAARLRRSRRGARRVRLFAVQTPLPELVAQLNDFRPAILAPYATTAALLATEAEAGRLHISPALVALAAEGLAPGEQQRIAAAFGAKVGNSYAATECPFLSYSCTHGWLHVNADWVVVEPVDAQYRPTAPGEQSHTVLITNLANRIQPILRYDLGDSVLARPDPCECGNPLPALRVQGRSADVLTFTSPDGSAVTITPLTLSALVERIPGIEVAQIVQTTPAALRVHLQPTAGADSDQAWRQVSTELTALFAAHGLEVALERGDDPPRPSAGGKYRLVQPLPPPSLPPGA